MKRNALGRTGLEVSEIGLGCWQLGGGFGPLDEVTAAGILDAALRLGVNFWDTADVYGGGRSETLIGDRLAGGGAVVVATKVGRGGGLFPDRYEKARVRQSIAASASRLRVECIDLVQLHTIPIEVLRDGAIFGWLEEFRDEGLIRHFGASVETIEEGLLCLRHPGVASLQIIFNLFRQDAAELLLPEAQKAGVGIIVRLPLASGLLTGRFGRGQVFAEGDHRNYNRDGQAFSVGETFSGLPFETGVELVGELEGMKPEGWPLAHLALRWILDHPAVSSVIAGVSRPEQLEDNVAAAEREPLPQDLRERLAAFYADKVRPSVRGDI
jgi:aryl-alcohol dehydrogenase-like predicted oxidoreductase